MTQQVLVNHSHLIRLALKTSF